MKKPTLVGIAAALALAFAPGALAHLPAKPTSPKLESRAASQAENLAHARYVCRRGGGDHRRWACVASSWLARELAETKSSIDARRVASLGPRGLAYELAGARGWPREPLDEIIGQESGWNPCRHYPSTTNCSYAGISACGIPQAVPCPRAWRGRLWETRFEQARWLVDYIARRYGDVWGALAHKRRTGWY